MVIVPTLSLSLDILLRAEVAIGAVVRAGQASATPGGKALNVAYYAEAMGAPVHFIALAADWMAARIRGELGSSATLTCVETTAWPRFDVAIVSDDGATTVINSGPPSVPEPEINDALDRIRGATARDDVLVVAGRQPAGIVERLLAIGARAGARVILDTSGPDLRSGSLAGPDVVKVSADEFGEAFGMSAERAWERGRSAAPQPGVLVITAGAAGSRAWIGDDGPIEVLPPSMTAVSTLGAGDAITAGLAAAMHHGAALRDGLVDGTAWAAASVRSVTARGDPAGVAALRHLVQVR